MIELSRLLPHTKDVDFEVLLESMSRYYCGNGAIYVEGIHFRAITNATLKVVFVLPNFLVFLFNIKDL
ncbi:hypothetical protein Hanom_Chr07g00624721 [Helianthus anomalus]